MAESRLPWIGGTVDEVVAHLLKQYRAGVSGDIGVIYASAVGMITTLADEERYAEPRPLDVRMADIRTVCEAVHFFEQDEEAR